jgi:hypothetical protein
VATCFSGDSNKAEVADSPDLAADFKSAAAVLLAEVFNRSFFSRSSACYYFIPGFFSCSLFGFSFVIFVLALGLQFLLFELCTARIRPIKYRYIAILGLG